MSDPVEEYVNGITDTDRLRETLLGWRRAFYKQEKDMARLSYALFLAKARLFDLLGEPCPTRGDSCLLGIHGIGCFCPYDKENGMNEYFSRVEEDDLSLA